VYAGAEVSGLANLGSPDADSAARGLATELEPADVELRALTKRFEDLVAVDAINLHVQAGEFLSLLGPSGCGKTTTLRLIAGFEQPDEGAVLISGEDVAHLPPYRRDVNTVFQSYALFPHLRVVDNVAYGLKQRGVSKDQRRARAESMLQLVRLPDMASRKPKQLSGGQQQRVALARALVMEPKVLLLDEPLGALDLKVRRQLQLELKRIQETVGVTFVYVTHDQEEALAMSDRVAVMSAGRIEQVGTPREIYDRPSTPFVADFIGETNFIERGSDTIAVRPERMQVRRGGPGDASGGLGGEVVTTMVIGPAVQCLVRGDDGQEMLARQQRNGGESPMESLRTGERVIVNWAEDAELVLARKREDAA
jgi:ABC-type Fe3+/spermidine/putrescine transport system ATPase subunit